LLFTLLFGIIEFGRLFYVFNTVQEVTRRAAREAVVSCVDNSNTSPAKISALFGGTSLPAGAEITAARINIDYLNPSNIAITGTNLTSCPTGNVSACLIGPANCVAFVQVSITGATYAPMVGLFPFLAVPIPASTVTMPAESLGYRS
jgi:Flp pilus assembly protein TadG